MPAGEIDLRGVLRHDHPPAAAAFPGPPRQRRDDLRSRHLRRIKKAVRRNLARPIAANPAQHQTPGGDDLIKQPRPALRPPHIPKLTNPLARHHRCCFPQTSI